MPATSVGERPNANLRPAIDSQHYSPGTHGDPCVTTLTRGLPSPLRTPGKAGQDGAPTDINFNSPGHRSSQDGSFIQDDDADNMQLILDFDGRDGDMNSLTGAHAPGTIYADTFPRTGPVISRSVLGRIEKQMATEFDADVAELDFDNFDAHDILSLKPHQYAAATLPMERRKMYLDPARIISPTTIAQITSLSNQWNNNNNNGGLGGVPMSAYNESFRMRNSIDILSSGGSRMSQSLFSSVAESLTDPSMLAVSMHFGDLEPGVILEEGAQEDHVPPYISTDSLNLSGIRDACVPHKHDYVLTFDNRLLDSMASRATTGNALYEYKDAVLSDGSDMALMEATDPVITEIAFTGSRTVSDNIFGLAHHAEKVGNNMTTWGHIKRSYDLNVTPQKDSAMIYSSKHTSLPNLKSSATPSSRCQQPEGDNIFSQEDGAGEYLLTAPASSVEDYHLSGYASTPPPDYSNHETDERQGETTTNSGGVSLLKAFREKFVGTLEKMGVNHGDGWGMEESGVTSGYVTGEHLSSLDLVGGNYGNSTTTGPTKLVEKKTNTDPLHHLSAVNAPNRFDDWEYREFYVNGRYIDINHNEIGFVPPSTRPYQSPAGLSSLSTSVIDGLRSVLPATAGDFLKTLFGNGGVKDSTGAAMMTSSSAGDRTKKASGALAFFDGAHGGNLNIEKGPGLSGGPLKPPRTFATLAQCGKFSTGTALDDWRGLRDSGTQIPVYVVNQSSQTADKGQFFTVVTTSSTAGSATHEAHYSTARHFRTGGGPPTRACFSEMVGGKGKASTTGNRDYEYFSPLYAFPPKNFNYNLPDLHFMKLPFQVPPLFPGLPPFPAEFCAGSQYNSGSSWGGGFGGGPPTSSNQSAQQQQQQPRGGNSSAFASAVSQLTVPNACDLLTSANSSGSNQFFNLPFMPGLTSTQYSSLPQQTLVNLPEPPKFDSDPLLTSRSELKKGSNSNGDHSVPVPRDSGLGNSSTTCGGGAPSGGPPHIQDWESLAVLLPNDVLQTYSFFRSNSNLLRGTCGVNGGLSSGGYFSGGLRTQDSLSIDKPLTSPRQWSAPPQTQDAAIASTSGGGVRMRPKTLSATGTPRKVRARPLSEPLSFHRLRHIESEFEPIEEEGAGGGGTGAVPANHNAGKAAGCSCAHQAQCEHCNYDIPLTMCHSRCHHHHGCHCHHHACCSPRPAQVATCHHSCGANHRTQRCCRKRTRRSTTQSLRRQSCKPPKICRECCEHDDLSGPDDGTYSDTSDGLSDLENSHHSLPRTISYHPRGDGSRRQSLNRAAVVSEESRTRVRPLRMTSSSSDDGYENEKCDPAALKRVQSDLSPPRQREGAQSRQDTNQLSKIHASYPDDSQRYPDLKHCDSFTTVTDRPCPTCYRVRSPSLDSSGHSNAEGRATATATATGTETAKTPPVTPASDFFCDCRTSDILEEERKLMEVQNVLVSAVTKAQQQSFGEVPENPASSPSLSKIPVAKCAGSPQRKVSNARKAKVFVSSLVMDEKRVLIQSTVEACDNIVSIFAASRSKANEKEVLPPANVVSAYIMKNLCPAVLDVLRDGLKMGKSEWGLIHASASLGPATRSIHELVSSLEDSSASDTERSASDVAFCSFISGLLRLHSLDCWMSYLVLKERLLSTFYEESAFFRGATSIYHGYFAELILAIQPLSLLPFDKVLPHSPPESSLSPTKLAKLSPKRPSLIPVSKTNREVRKKFTFVEKLNRELRLSLYQHMSDFGSPGEGEDFKEHRGGDSPSSPTVLPNDSRIPKSSSIPSRLDNYLSTTNGASDNELFANCKGTDESAMSIVSDSGSEMDISVEEPLESFKNLDRRKSSADRKIAFVIESWRTDLPGYLNIHKGESLNVILESSGWLRCQRGGSQDIGLVPRNKVTFMTFL